MEQTASGNSIGAFPVGAWFADLVAPVLDRFADPTLGPLLAFAILVLGLLIAFVFSLRIVQIGWRLAGLASVLKAIPDPSAFAMRFAEVATAFEREPLTRHGWSEFRDSLILPSQAGEAIANTARPGRYLNRHEAGLQYRRMQSLPNLFVGLGLLLTFVGLVAALKAASGGISGGDVSAITGSLAKLLGAATAKFYTSIAGLGCSMLLGFVIRHSLARIDHRFDTLTALLEQRLVAATPESLASRLLEQAREQTEQLKLINTDIAVAIGQQVRDALDATLPHHLATAATPLAERVSAMIEAVSSQTRDGVGEMIQAFGERLDGAAGDRLSELASTLSQLTTTLDGTARRMGQGGDELGAALHGAAGQLAATVEAVRDTVAALALRIKTENEASQSRVNEQFDQIAQAMSIMASRLVSSVEDGSARAREGASAVTATLVERVGEAAERLSLVAAGIEGAIKQASERGQAAVHETAVQTARELGTAGSAAVAELRGSVDAIGERLTAWGSEIARTTHGLAELEAGLAAQVRAITEAESGTRAVAGALGETAVRIKTAAVEAGESLRAAAQPIVGVGERLVQSTEAALRSNEALERMLNTAAIEAKRHADTAESALSQLESVWQRHVQRFDVVDQQLGQAFQEISVGLRENLGHLAKFSSKIDSYTAKALGHLAGTVDELQEIAVEISNGLHRHPGNGGGPGARR